MFPRKLTRAVEQSLKPSSVNTKFEFEISDTGYGKDHVKILHVRRDGNVHHIKEFEVNTHLKLYSKKDYLNGDNSDIIATDSQKNTVYLLAKKFGVKSPEDFALTLTRHFLSKYRHVKEAHVHIEEHPWDRIRYTNAENKPKEHNHGFLFTPVATRYCDVIHQRDVRPTIISGLKNLRVLKTTRSSFVDFVDDEFRSLPDMEDRLFSTNVSCCWEYLEINDVNFDQIWTTVKEIILKNFAGDPIEGVNSPSVQNTIYLSQRDILAAIRQIGVVNIEMPNIHYYPFDMSKFPKVIQGENKEVYHPVDKPNGNIFSQLARVDNLKSKL
ncbi:uricase [Contarinia nasturtii]|uniref:uricase n=1 Tax=Contarinia nasturtii TaxID=265458 RepID=UPI0012D47E5F|nr:uricase [Contarinia nasturtii]